MTQGGMNMICYAPMPTPHARPMSLEDMGISGGLDENRIRRLERNSKKACERLEELSEYRRKEEEEFVKMYGYPSNRIDKNSWSFKYKQQKYKEERMRKEGWTI